MTPDTQQILDAPKATNDELRECVRELEEEVEHYKDIARSHLDKIASQQENIDNMRLQLDEQAKQITAPPDPHESPVECLTDRLQRAEARIKELEAALHAIKEAPGGGPGRRIAMQALGETAKE